MLKSISKNLKRLSNLIFKIAEGIYTEKRPKQDELLQNWYKIKGDETLRLDYPLNFDSIVFDIGGYKGDWARDIFCKYVPSIYVFEPVPQYADLIRDYFKTNDKIKVFSFGISGNNETAFISLEENRSSVFGSDNKNGIEIKLKKASDFINENNIQKIDLMKMNIEGGEYELLEDLVSTGIIKNITDIQIQFHDFVPNALERMKMIRSKLERTHSPTYQYDFLWENWHIK